MDLENIFYELNNIDNYKLKNGRVFYKNIEINEEGFEKYES